MNSPKLLLVSVLLLACIIAAAAAEQNGRAQRLPLADGWLLQSAALVPEDGARVSTVDYKPQRWWKTRVPSTVLGALTRNGVYP
ncbi:MAG: hypothetical protein N2689_07140, partial [Verrucomicrobiae bacterium]|nr:hypothetical protein [Verrucomicrobiae bacterium]